MNDIIIAVRNALLKMRSDLASKVDDVKVNGTSVVQDGTANVNAEPLHGDAALIYSNTLTEAVDSLYVNFGDAEGYRALLIKTYTNKASSGDTLMCLFNETQRSTSQLKPILPIPYGLQNDTITRFAIALSVGGQLVGFSHGSGSSSASAGVNLQSSCTGLGQNGAGKFKSVLFFGANGVQIPANSSFKIYGVKGGVI